jgi:hypothetical protein
LRCDPGSDRAVALETHRRKQNVAVLGALPAIYKDFAGLEIHIADLDLDELAHAHGRIEEQLEQDLMLHVTAVLDGSEEAFQASGFGRNQAPKTDRLNHRSRLGSSGIAENPLRPGSWQESCGTLRTFVVANTYPKTLLLSGERLVGEEDAR